MFHSPSLTHHLHHRRRTTAPCLWLYGTPHSTLPGCRYTLELSRDPRFPEVSTAPGFPLQPSYVAVRSSAVVCGRRCALSVRPAGGTLSRFHLQPGHTSISSRAPFHGRPTSLTCCPGLTGRYLAVSRDVRLGRTGELHPRAPSVAAPALLEACGFSVCSVEDWRSSTCWTGGPA